jgi:hypothetical protein
MQFGRPRWSLSRSRAVCLAAVVFLGALSVRAGFGAEALNDPYQILGKYYEAMGGLDKLKAERTRHFEATVSVYGLTGTVREWDRVPSEKRQEVDLTVFRQTSGDNGEFPWVVDQNGKLQIQKDEPTLKKRRIEELVATFDHLNPNSKNFVLTLLSTDKVGDTDCYVVKLASTINEDYRLFYINTTNFYLEKLTLVDPAMEVRTVYSDYRDQGGMMIPFHQESEVLPIGQKQTVELTSYESNIEIDPALFEPPKQDVKDYKFANGTSSENIPIRYTGDHVFLEVTLNCDRKTWCLDTGAAVTVIDPGYAASLGLESSGSIKASGAGQTVDASFVTLPPLSIQGITFDSQQVASIEVSGLFKKMGMDVAGVLGYDFLSRFVTKVDYANQRISLYDPATFEYTGGGEIVDAALRDNLFTLPMSVDGKYSGAWSVDLGAGGTTFFYSFAEKNHLLNLKGFETLAGGAGGYFTMRVGKFANVDLAGFDLRDQVFSVPLAKGAGAFGMREETGNIGNNILRHFVLYLDYSKQQVIFEKGADFDREFPEGKTGLGLVAADSGGIEVFYVSPATPAEKAGFRKGDVVVSINDIPVESFAGVIAISELFKAKAGTEYAIEISREGKTRQLKLKLEDLL